MTLTLGLVKGDSFRHFETILFGSSAPPRLPLIHGEIVVDFLHFSEKVKIEPLKRWDVVGNIIYRLLFELFFVLVVGKNFPYELLGGHNSFFLVAEMF